MKFTFFYHSLVSDWNHGNAHFLRGVVSELINRGHQVQVFEPMGGWSRDNLLADHGPHALDQFQMAYPQLNSVLYDRKSLDLQQVAEASDVIIVHEWNEAWLVNELGNLRNNLQKGNNADQSFLLLFHDTNHRSVSEPEWLRRFQLEFYDGVLASGDILSNVYRAHGWPNSVWNWHAAADDKIFYPRPPNDIYPSGDVAWIGNWGNDERARELDTFLFNPVRELALACHVYGVRYPTPVLEQLRQSHITYCGWLPNFRAPEVFANHAVTIHVPRHCYVETLPGIPSIRLFEAMACGIPLISAPWQDSEHLFTPGEDFLIAHNAAEMQHHLRRVLNDKDQARHLADHALTTIRSRHTCSHRVDQLLEIIESLGAPTIESITAEIMKSIDAHFSGGAPRVYH